MRHPATLKTIPIPANYYYYYYKAHNMFRYQICFNELINNGIENVSIGAYLDTITFTLNNIVCVSAEE